MNSVKKVKTVLVSGGAHFLGSHLCEALLINGFRVICLDDFSFISDKNLVNCKKNKNFEILKFSLEKGEIVEDIENVDYIFHASGLDIVSLNKEGSLNSLLINSQGTKILLQKALSDKAEFLFVSLVDIYSGVASRLSLENYFGQDTHEEDILALYEAKRFGEALVEEFRKEHEIKAKIVRIRDIYGPRMPLNSVFPINCLFNSFIESQKISLFGDGLEEVYPTYISDVVYGLIKAMFSKDTEGKVYYLVSPQKFTLRTISETLLTFYKEGGSINFIPTDKITLPLPQIDISLSKKDLRWYPNISLEEGFEKTVAWFLKDIHLKNEKGLKEIKETKDFTKKDFSYEATEIVAKDEKENDIQTATTELSPEKELNKKEEVIGKSLPKSKSESGLFKSFLKFLNKKKESSSNLKEKKILVAGDTDIKLHYHFNKLKISFVIVCLIFIIFGFFSPFLLSGFFAMEGVNSIEKSKQAISEFSLTEANKQAITAEKSFRTASGSLNNLLWIFSLVHERQRFQQYVYLLSSGEDIAKGIISLTSSVDPILSSFDIFLDHDQNENNIGKVVPLVKADIIQARENFSEAQSKLTILENRYFPNTIWNKVDALKTQLNDGKEMLARVENLVDILPSLMGEEEDKVYLIVFQNNSEMRATGGFIGSYARVLVSGGKIKEIKVDDVYNPDGLLKNKEPQIPPQALKEHLGVTNWGMRDANWSPDFSVSASDIERLYEKTTNDDISGVIGVDLYTIENLIEKIGPIHPVGYNEEISALNFFERAEYYSEVGFTPGSTGKKDFLGACADELIKKLQEMSAKDLGILLSSTFKNLTEKHILFSFKEPIISDFLKNQNLDGRIANEKGDFLWVVDSNVGGNKANYFIDRSINYNVSVNKEGNMRADLVITYKHKGQTDTWPGGNYKNYLRVYVPEGAKTVSTEGFSSEVTTTTDLGKTVFSGLTNVRINSEQEIKISYDLPISLSINDKNLQYALYVQKQSGSTADPFVMNISYPAYLSVKDTSSSGQQKEQSFSFIDPLKVDHKLIVNFEK